MTPNDFSTPFTLYTYVHSICALMVRMTYQMRSTPRNGRPEMKLLYKDVDISLGGREQYSEWFLCDVNQDGFVPVLANPKVLGKPMPESVDISWYLCDWYPNLLPKEHEKVIRELIDELHLISFRLLTFGVKTRYPDAGVDYIKGLLQRTDISDVYRKTLEYKLSGMNKWVEERTESELREHEKRARELCAKVVALMEKYPVEGTGFRYIFGQEPTVLDAHIVVFLGRLYEKERFDILPPVLVKWHEHIRNGDLWAHAVPAGTTLPPNLWLKH